MIEVYHAIHPTFGLAKLNFPGDYEKVAEVNTNSIDTAFQLTNHIDRSWWENPEVKAVKQTRSTSVGDVVLDVNTGTYYLCEPMGWSVITPE